MNASTLDSPSKITGTHSRLSMSIVSHNQGSLIRQLLSDLRELNPPCDEILLTLNIPEDESFLDQFCDLPIRIIRNIRRKGFGANHNAAFELATGDYFAVVNPDIRLHGFSTTLLTDLLDNPRIGIAAPIVYSCEGEIQDSARRFPTFFRLVQRKLSSQTGPDYVIENSPIKVDWVAGMFMVFRS